MLQQNDQSTTPRNLSLSMHWLTMVNTCAALKQKISYYDKIRLSNKNNLGISPNGEIIEDNWSLKEEEFRKF